MDDELRVEERGDGVRFAVRVTPRASRAKVGGVIAGALKLSVNAPPVDGAANAAVVDLLARALGVARGRVTIVGGERARQKVVAVSGIDPGAVRALVK